MTTAWQGVPNSVALERAYAGTQTQAGTSANPTFRLYGKFQLNPRRALADREEYAGTYFADYTPVFGPWEIDGTYDQALAYEDLAILPRYALQGGDTPVSDGQATPGYTRTLRPSADSLNIDAMTVESGVPGLPFKADTLIFPEFTVSGDVDDSEAAWKWSSPVRARTHDPIASVTGTATGGSTTTVVNSGASYTVNAYQGGYVRMLTGTAGNIGKVRRIASNTATTLTLAEAFPSAVVAADTYEIMGMFTAGITDRTREIISAPGTKLYLDTSSAIGTTEQKERFISFSVTYQSGITGFKRFMENTENYSARLDQGKKRVVGQVRIEFDSLREYTNWRNKTPEKLRIVQEGTVINASPETRKKAQIDVYTAYWSEVTADARQNNLTRTWAFRGFVDTTEGVPFQLVTKTKLATLP